MKYEPYYEEQGTGFPLILLHGNGESHEYFSHQIEYFRQSYHVIAIDTRGHGQSPRGEGAFTIRRFAEDLHDFMVEHAIGKAHILGFSDGGNIALCFALRYPEMVETLILNGANLCPAGIKRSVQLPIEIGYRIAKGFAGRNEKARAKTELLGLMVNDPNIAPKSLHTLGMPALVIAGTRDMVRRCHTEQIASNLPNVTLVFLEGDHFIAHKKAAAFNRAVENFLSMHKRIDRGE